MDYRRLKTAKKCYKSHKIEVSLSELTLERKRCLKLVKINLLGHEITPYRAPNKTTLSRSLNKGKVRLTKIAKLSTLVKKSRTLTHSVFSGSKMSKDGAEKPDKDDDEKNKRKKSKDRDKRLENSKSKRAKLSKHWEIDPEAFSHEIDMAYKTLQGLFHKKK